MCYSSSSREQLCGARGQAERGGGTEINFGKHALKNIQGFGGVSGSIHGDKSEVIEAFTDPILYPGKVLVNSLWCDMDNMLRTVCV